MSRFQAFINVDGHAGYVIGIVLTVLEDQRLRIWRAATRSRSCLARSP